MTSKTKKVWTILDIINWGKNYLTQNGISNAKLELEWFLAELLQCNRIDLYVRFEEPLNPTELDKIRDFIKRRKNHEPFQYILGKAPFYGSDFLINSNVLIPRPETETIIDLAKNINMGDNFLEIGTGSGCIAITLLKEKIFSHGFAIDVSNSAVQIAEKNKINFKIENLKLEIMDFLAQPINQKFDCIISNPPYIPVHEMDSLKDNVKKFEPQIALTDKSDGLTFYRKIAEEGFNLLNPNGYILLETGGENQYKSVKNLFFKKKYRIKTHKDQNGENRFLELHLQ